MILLNPFSPFRSLPESFSSDSQKAILLLSSHRKVASPRSGFLTFLLAWKYIILYLFFPPPVPSFNLSCVKMLNLWSSHKLSITNQPFLSPSWPREFPYSVIEIKGHTHNIFICPVCPVPHVHQYSVFLYRLVIASRVFSCFSWLPLACTGQSIRRLSTSSLLFFFLHLTNITASSPFFSPLFFICLSRPLKTKKIVRLLF